MLLSDRQIKELSQRANKPMITPFVPTPVRAVENEDRSTRRVISYGLSSYGYDARLSGDFKIFHNAFPDIVDPKNFNEKAFLPFSGPSVVVPPNSFVLGCTMERFIIPRNILTLCIGKSTYARCGLIVNVTPLEPEWEGQVTLEISNTTPLPARVYAFEGICQFIFIQGEACNTSYADKGGKYQNQVGVVTAKP